MAKRPVFSLRVFSVLETTPDNTCGTNQIRFNKYSGSGPRKESSMEMVTNAVNWVELPVSDFERAKTFYSKIFDYDMPAQPMGDIMMGFLLFEQGKGVGGAIVKGEGLEPSSQGTIAYLNGGEDLSVVLNRIEAAGGKVIIPKTEITPEVGFFAIFHDTEGNRVALHSMK
jgi:predicted enzyme related to lactoylglutathione lyase